MAMKDIEIYDVVAGLDGELLDQAHEAAQATDRSTADNKRVKERSALTLKKWLPAAVIAACLAISAGVVLGLAFGGSNRQNPGGADPLTNKPGGTALSPKASTDRFSEQSELGQGAFSDTLADRMAYFGLHFYENGGKTYMFYAEYRNKYEFDGEKFKNTGSRANEHLFFTEGTYKGNAFAGGVFHCVGGNESGLFRIDLDTNAVEKLIDCDEVVSQVTVSGARIYYVSYTWKNAHTIFEDRSDVNYSLKCADLEAGTITVLCSGFKHRIPNLRIVDGTVWFASGDTVYQIKDNMLYSFKTDVKEIMYLAVSGGSVFVFSYEYVDSGENGDSGNSGNGGSSQIFVNTVCEYGEDGSLLGSVSSSDRFFGGMMDELTVYNGSAVALGADGLYLLDVKKGEYEIIVPLDLSALGIARFNSFTRDVITKTVYGGKLYFQYGSTVLEYSDGGVRTFQLDDAED